MSDYDDDDDFDEDYVYGNYEGRLNPDYHAFETSFYEGPRTVEAIAAQAGVITTRQKGQVIRDPLFKFYVYVNAVAHRFIEEGYIPTVSRNDVEPILVSIQKVKSPQYKNPEAFVLGYSVAKSGKINKKQFDFLVTKLADLENITITPMDVIRYANLWLNL